MQVVSIFIAVLAISRLVFAQSPQSGYNYPSPFNPLAPGAQGDLGQQPTPYAGQPGYNNPQYTPSVPQGPAFVATVAPGFNQQFGQPTQGTHLAAGTHSGIPGHSPSVGFGPSSQPGFQSTAAPSSKGFESSFPHSGVHSGGHLGGHSVSGAHPIGSLGTSFPGSVSSPGFSGSSDGGSSGFGNQVAPGFVQGQPGFGGQSNNNFGPTGGSTQFQGQGQGGDDGSYNGGDYSAIPGTPGVDYPVYTEIPKTSFDCKNQQFPGYYADVEAQCQVFHICALNTTFNFLCPNGTIFSQEHLVCVWWNQFDCNSAPSLYNNNAYIYDYSKTGQSQGDNQAPSRNFGNGPDATGFDGAQGQGFGGQGSPGFGTTQPGSTGFGQSGSPGFGTHSPSSGFGASSPSGPGFGASPSSHSSGSAYPSPSGFGGSHPSQGFGATHSGIIPSSGFGQPAPSLAPGFGSPHIPSVGSSHTSSHNIPSGHNFPAQTHSGAAGHEQYPIAPSSQTDFQSPVITPTISSPSTFGVPGTPTGYPAAGTPTPIITGINGEPSREYLPSRRNK